MKEVEEEIVHEQRSSISKEGALSLQLQLARESDAQAHKSLQELQQKVSRRCNHRRARSTCMRPMTRRADFDPARFAASLSMNVDSDVRCVLLIGVLACSSTT